MSTDHDEIAQMIKAHGAEASFRQSTEPADDYNATTAVTAHAVARMIGDLQEGFWKDLD